MAMSRGWQQLRCSSRAAIAGDFEAPPMNVSEVQQDN